MLWGIYSAIYGEVNVSVEKCAEIKGDYVEKQQICFISVTLKSWSARKRLDPTACILIGFSATKNATKTYSKYSLAMQRKSLILLRGNKPWSYTSLMNQFPDLSVLNHPQVRVYACIHKIQHVATYHDTITDRGKDFSLSLTLIMLTWTIWRTPTNASKWRMGFNSAFKGLNSRPVLRPTQLPIQRTLQAL